MKRKIPFRVIFGYCSLGLLSYIVGDLITLYGLKIFAPLSDQRFALYLTFDMDFWIGLLALLGLVFGINNRRNAVFGLIAIGAYLGLMLCFQQSALAIIDARTRTGQQPIDKIYALPQPFIPFHWKLVIDHQAFYETADLSFFGTATRLMDRLLTNKNFRIAALSTFLPDEIDPGHNRKTRSRFDNTDIGGFRTQNQLQWQKISKYGDSPKDKALALEVWRHDSFAKFRRFSSLPILYRIDTDPGSTCVWYTDLRYVLPFMKPPFRYGMCRQQLNHYWQLARLRRNTENIRQRIEP